jgi:hypothetical protein
VVSGCGGVRGPGIWVDFSGQERKADRAFARMPTLSTMRPSRRWGAQIFWLSLDLGHPSTQICYGLDLGHPPECPPKWAFDCLRVRPAAPKGAFRFRSESKQAVEEGPIAS